MKYSTQVAPEKLAVRRETACAMIENAKLFDSWVEEGVIKPIDPEAAVLLFDHADVKNAYLLYRGSKVRK